MDERTAVRRAEDAVVENGLLDIRPGRGHDARRPRGAVVEEKVTERPLRRIGDAGEHGQIFLFKCPRTHLLREQLRRHPRPRKHHHARNGGVEPVDRAHTGVRVAETVPDALRHTARLVGGDDAGGLDADENAVVLIKNFHERLRCGRTRRPAYFASVTSL